MADIAYTGTSDLPRERDEAVVAGRFWDRTTWGAIVAGAATAIAAQLFFTLLGIAVGMSSVTAYSAVDSASASGDYGYGRMSVAAGVWWLVSGTVALLIGGMVVGRAAGLRRSPDLHVQALTMWAATAIFGFAVVWSGAGMMASTSPSAALLARDTGYGYGTGYGVGGGYGAGATSGALNRGLDRAQDATGIGGSTGTSTAGADDTAVGRTANRAGLSAADAAETARRAARNASWWMVIGLVLGIVAALAGAWMTAPEPAVRYRNNIPPV